MTNRIRMAVAGLAVAAVGVLGWSTTAAAQSFRSGNNTTVSANERVDSSLFASGRTIDIAGTVNGDVICAGQNITISGQINGDVICAGQSVHVTGRVDGNVRLAGQNVTLGGDVARNASIVAQSFNSEGNGRVTGDMSIAGQDSTLNGSVGRDLAVTGSSVTIDGPVGRNVQANGSDTVQLGRQARVDGTITYSSNRDLQRDNGAVVTGDITRNPYRQTGGNSGQGGLVAFVIYGFLALLIISLALVLLMPRLFHAASNQILLKPGRAVLTGLIVGLAVPAIIIALMLSVIGIPLAILALLVWIVALTFSGPVAGYTLGRVLMRNSRNAVVIMLVGGIVLLILYLVPIINFFVVLAVLWFGLGGLALTAPRLRRPGYTVESAHAVLARRERHDHDEEVREA